MKNAICSLCGRSFPAGEQYKLNDGLDHDMPVCKICYDIESDRRTMILGVGADAETVVNHLGGKQSYSPYAFHMLPARALFAAAAVAKEGAEKYGETRSNKNYIKISCDSHLNHALQHIYAFLAGDTSDCHLSHALTRLLFGYECSLLENVEGTSS